MSADGMIEGGREALGLFVANEARDCLAGCGSAGDWPWDEVKDGVRRWGSNAEEVGLAYDMVPERDATVLGGTMKSSANSWSAVSSSIDVSADDDDRREPILSARDRILRNTADPSQSRWSGYGVTSLCDDCGHASRHTGETGQAEAVAGDVRVNLALTTKVLRMWTGINITVHGPGLTIQPRIRSCVMRIEASQ